MRVFVFCSFCFIQNLLTDESHFLPQGLKLGANCRWCAPNAPLVYTLEDKENAAERHNLKYLEESKEVRCLDCGYTWKPSWHDILIDQYKCWMCNGSKRYSQSEIVSLCAEHGYTVHSEYSGVHNPIILKCPNKHEWITSIRHFRDLEQRCPHCYHNKIEFEISKFLTGLNIHFIPNDRKTIKNINNKPLELDFYIPEHKLAIEYCGLYWHSEASIYYSYPFKELTDKMDKVSNEDELQGLIQEKDELLKVARYRHIEKLNACREKDIRLLTVFGDEWSEKKEIVLSKIKSMLGLQQKINARDCKFLVLDKQSATQFLNGNHLQGTGSISEAYGLTHNDEIVSVITITPHHRQNSEYKHVINRFCNKKDITVTGGASKLLFHITTRPLLTFADLRWSEGELYKKLGFELISESDPDYSYCKTHQRFSKQSLKKTEEEQKGDKTEYQLRLEQGYFRIWDCGKQTWVLK